MSAPTGSGAMSRDNTAMSRNGTAMTRNGTLMFSIASEAGEAGAMSRVSSYMSSRWTVDSAAAPEADTEDDIWYALTANSAVANPRLDFGRSSSSVPRISRNASSSPSSWLMWYCSSEPMEEMSVEGMAGEALPPTTKKKSAPKSEDARSCHSCRNCSVDDLCGERKKGVVVIDGSAEYYGYGGHYEAKGEA